MRNYWIIVVIIIYLLADQLDVTRASDNKIKYSWNTKSLFHFPPSRDALCFKQTSITNETPLFNLPGDMLEEGVRTQIREKSPVEQIGRKYFYIYKWLVKSTRVFGQKFGIITEPGT